MLRNGKTLEAVMAEIKDASLPWVDWLARLEKGWEKERDERYRDALYMLCKHGERERFPLISKLPEIQAAYVAQRIDGSSHNFAEMVCLRSPPMSNSDREFLEGRGGCFDQFAGQEWIGDAYKAEAQAHGVSTTGKVYLNGLARYPGDPEAWISDRGEVQRRLEERGWGSQGSVNVKAREPDELPPDTAIADDIVDQAVVNKIEADPSLAFRDQRDLREQVAEEITPHWNK